LTPPPIDIHPPQFNPLPSNQLQPLVAGQPLTTCNQYITPACIFALYSIDLNVKPYIPGNGMAIFEYGNAYSQTDLNKYFKEYAPRVPQGSHPIIELIDGGTAPAIVSEAGLESNLDFQLAYPIVHPQKLVLYQVGTSGGFNTFLDAIDGVC
jgi:tripeptidyl-peptidase-1